MSPSSYGSATHAFKHRLYSGRYCIVARQAKDEINAAAIAKRLDNPGVDQPNRTHGPTQPNTAHKRTPSCMCYLLSIQTTKTNPFQAMTA